MMEMLGMQTEGRLLIALSFTVPHEFFVITGTRTNKTTIQNGDTMHLMAQVMDKETGVVAPGVEPSIEIMRDGEEAATNQPWPMLSQPMGFHFGDNVAVSGEATYRFEVTVNRAQSVLTDDLADVFTENTFTFEQEFRPSVSADLGFESTGDAAGTAGAIEPMDMEMLTIPQQPAFDQIRLGLTEPQFTDDIGVAIGVHDDPGALRFDTGTAALIAATQSRYNRYPLGFSGLSARVTRDGDEVFADDLTSAVSGDLGHYYGAGSPALQTGDTVEIEFTTPPQLARHRGYEQAFLDLDQLTFTL
jgi:hypothetical protein